MSAKKATQPWRNRIIEYGEIPAAEFLANEQNWRIHGMNQQRALGGVLDDVGWVQNVIVNRRSDPSWGRDQNIETMVDGHLRVSLALSRGEQTLVPVTYVDLTRAEESEILATLDPLAAMAATDQAQLAVLLAEVSTTDADVMAMLEDLARRSGVIPADDPNNEWSGMPEYEHTDQTSVRDIIVHFKTHEDVAAFAELIGQKLGDKLKYCWYPEAEIGRTGDKAYE